MRRRRSGCVQTRPETCREIVHAGSSGDPLDLDAVADALSAPVEALGTLEELALAAAAKYAGDGVREDRGEVEVGKLEAKACAAVGGMIDAARGIAAAAATSRAMHERRAAALASPGPTSATTTASAATSPFACFERRARVSAATSPLAAFDRASETTTTIDPRRPPPTPASPVVRVTRPAAGSSPGARRPFAAGRPPGGAGRRGDGAGGVADGVGGEGDDAGDGEAERDRGVAVVEEDVHDGAHQDV